MITVHMWIILAHNSEIPRQRQDRSKRALVTPTTYTVDSVSPFPAQKLKLDSNRTDIEALLIVTEQLAAELIEKEPDISLSNGLLINFLPLFYS